MNDDRRAKLLRRDAELARLVERMAELDDALAEGVLGWALARDADRRSLAEEALERYRELNLLYDLAERSSSLDPAVIAGVASAEVARICRRGTSVALLIDDDGSRLRPAAPLAGLATDLLPSDGVRLGAGIVGTIAARGDGEIVNEPGRDARATPEETALGALMVAPLRVGERRLGVLLIAAEAGAADGGFTAGEHRMLSAVAALTAPALDAALLHVRTVAHARARELELERQLDELRSEVGARRREESVSEITGTEYFRSLRDQAEVLRQTIESGGRKAEP